MIFKYVEAVERSALLTPQQYERVIQIITDNGWGGTCNAEARALAQLKLEQRTGKPCFRGKVVQTKA